MIAEYVTIPNLISAFRLILIPVLWIFAMRDMPNVVAAGILVAAFSDTLDGVLARRLGQESESGSQLDSLADNLLKPSIIAWLLMLEPQLLADHPWALLAAITVYAATITVGLIKFRRFGNLHLYSGKVGSVLQYIFIVQALITPGYSELLFYLAVGMFIFTNLEALVLLLTRSEVNEHIGSIFLPGLKRLYPRTFTSKPRLLLFTHHQLLWYSLFLVIGISILAAFLLHLALPRQSVEGCPLECAANLERRAGPLRIISLNMLHGYPEFEDLSLRMDLIANEIRRLDADLVLLQEVPWTKETGNVAAYLARQLGYNHLYFRANGSRQLIQFEEGEAILSRFPLTAPLFTALEPRAGYFENRVVLGATANTPLGEMAFFVTHLTNKDSAQNRGQAESLKAFVEDHVKGPALVAGDFNAREDSPQISDLAEEWMDIFRSVYPNDQGFTCCIDNLASGPEETLEKRIDFIFLVPYNNNGGAIANIQRVFDQPFTVGSNWQWASDHTGLMLEMEP